MKKLCAAVVATLVLVLMTPALAAHADDVPLQGVQQVTGLATDVSRGVYWATEAGGGQVTALSSDGRKLGTVTYPARTSSVQAIAFAGSALYVADIGGTREQVRLLRLDSLAYGAATATEVILAYPDGPHDAKTLMVSPRGNVYVVTAGPSPAIYRASLPTRGQGQLTRVTEAPEGVTDGTFSADGQTVILRTLDEIVVLDAFSWERTGSAFVVPQQNGQAIARQLRGTGVVLVDGAALSAHEMPTAISTVRPSPPPSPLPSPTPTPTATAVPTAEAESDSGVSLRGTFTALGIAFAVSLVAAGVVAFVRKK